MEQNKNMRNSDSDDDTSDDDEEEDLFTVDKEVGQISTESPDRTYIVHVVFFVYISFHLSFYQIISLDFV